MYFGQGSVYFGIGASLYVYFIGSVSFCVDLFSFVMSLVYPVTNVAFHIKIHNLCMRISVFMHALHFSDLFYLDIFVQFFLVLLRCHIICGLLGVLCT